MVLGVAGAVCGIWAVRGGEKRIGWGAVFAAVVGVAVGIGATKSGVSNLERVVVWSALFAAMLRYATPLLFAALGGVMSERSGVINIGLEGMMLMGAFWGVWGADTTGSWIGGLIIGMVAGVLLALVHALFAVTLRADQIVSGFSMNFLAAGITGYFYVSIYGAEGTPEGIPRAPDVALPLIEDIPFVGDVIGRMNILIWLGLITVLLAVAAAVPHADGAAAALGRREPAGRGDRRAVAGAHPLPRGGDVGRAGSDRRRVPVDRLRGLVRR